MLTQEYRNFVNKKNTELVDEDHLKEVNRHSKTFGIVPDTQSKDYLKRVLKKMKSTNEKFRKLATK